jgi:NACHT domain
LGGTLLADAESDAALKQLVQQLLGHNVSSIILHLLAYLVALRLLIQPVTDSFRPFWQLVDRYIIAHMRKPEAKKRARRRAQFARYVEYELRKIDDQEEWRDSHFTELEAEVEVRGRQKMGGLLPFLLWSHNTLRRERSLTRALAKSKERLILLEGSPGSGKSVALRHLAQRMAGRSARARRPNVTLPVYVNLRGLKSEKGSINADLIREFVLETLNRASNRDVTRFLEDEFDRGMKEGSWLFLFDSFDELPEVLGATEADEVVQVYTNAIDDFLHGMNECRGIIASREFRGPRLLRTSSWPRFRITTLSRRRQLTLIRRADLDWKGERALRAELFRTDATIQALSGNPLFLGLICEYVRENGSFPNASYDVFESYVTHRFKRDEFHILGRFGLNSDQVRAITEVLAFCMSAEPGLGLSPTRSQVIETMVRQHSSAGRNVQLAMNALEYIKLARFEATVGHDDDPTFTFSHRRFQEYFATCIVLRQPHRVSAFDLLTDGRWRETAVTICQTQTGGGLNALLNEAHSLLAKAVGDGLPFAMDPVSVLTNGSPPGSVVGPFSWPAQTLHILGILNAGFATDDHYFPQSIRSKADNLLVDAFVHGLIYDQQWAVEVCGTTSEGVLLGLIRAALRRGSPWLRETAYRQIGRLRSIPPDMAKDIYHMLLRMAVGGNLRRENLPVTAQLRRIDKPGRFLAAKRLLLITPLMDLALHGAWVITVISQSKPRVSLLSGATVGLILVGLLSHCFIYALRAVFASSTSDFRLVSWLDLRDYPDATVYLTAFLLGCARLVLLVASFGVSSAMTTYVALYAASWAVCALIAAAAGRLVQPWWWLTPQLVIVEELARGAGEAVRGIAHWLRRLRIGSVARSAIGLAVLATIVSVVIWLGGWIMIVVLGLITSVLRPVLSGPINSLSHTFKEMSESTKHVLGVVSLWLIGAILVVIVLKESIARVVRWIWYRRWIANLGGPIDGSTLLQYVKDTKSVAELNQLFRRIREERLIGDEPDGVDAVNDLIVAVEHASRTLKLREGNWFRLRMLTDVRGIPSLLNRAWNDWKPRAVSRYLRSSLESELRPEFTCSYFRPWWEAFVDKRGSELSHTFTMEIIDEMGRIVATERASSSASAMPR